jgi:YggT family protein
MVAFLAIFLTAFKWLIFIDIVLSWVMPDEQAFPRNLTRQITDPLYAPIRAVLKPERMGGLDLSPMVVLVVIWTMEGMLAGGL